MPSHAHDRYQKGNFFLGGETQIYINQTVTQDLFLQDHSTYRNGSLLFRV